jgi:hypothetical protein
VPRPISIAFELFTWWVSVPPGVGVTMDEMMDQISVGDSQTVRNALVQLRMGRVRDPSRPGQFLRRIPIRYSHAERKYYDFGKVTSSGVDAQIPGGVLANRFGELLTRVATLDSAMGADGLVRSADQLLDDAGTRSLIAQLPLKRIWDVATLALQVGQARQLLEMESLKNAASTGADDVPGDDSTEKGD